MICADGLTGIKKTIATAFPKTEYQKCIVHQVRNTSKYVPDKDRKAFAIDLEIIYQTADKKQALAALDFLFVLQRIGYLLLLQNTLIICVLLLSFYTFDFVDRSYNHTVLLPLALLFSQLFYVGVSIISFYFIKKAQLLLDFLDSLKDYCNSTLIFYY